MRAERRRADLSDRDWEFPPKPPWMRWKTYTQFYERWEWYEQQADAALAPWILKLGGLV